MSVALLAQVVQRHADHGSNVIGIGAVVGIALLVVGGFIAYAMRPPRNR